MTARWAGPSIIAASFWACSSASILASVGLFTIMQQDFLPSDDTGRLTGQIQAANGTSFNQMYNYLDEVGRVIECRSQCRRRVRPDAQRQRRRRHQSAVTLNIVALKPLSQRKLQRRRSGPRIAPQADALPRHQRLHHQSAHDPHRRARRAVRNYQYTMQGLDLDQLKDVSDRLVA